MAHGVVIGKYYARRLQLNSVTVQLNLLGPHAVGYHFDSLHACGL